MSLSPLPLTTPPFPWEDISSFVTRHARLMHYEHASWILQPEKHSHHIPLRDLSTLTEPADFAMLSLLLSTSEHDLSLMTLNRFAPIISPLLPRPTSQPHYLSYDARHAPLPELAPMPNALFEKRMLRFFFLPNQTTQICTLCLQDSPSYDRLFWKFRFLLSCPLHHCVLLRLCLNCKRPISSWRLHPLTCHSCGHTLSSIPLPPESSFLPLSDALSIQALTNLTLTPLSDTDPRTSLPPLEYIALLRAFSIALRPLLFHHYELFLPHPLLSCFPQALRNTWRKDLLPDLSPPHRTLAIHWAFQNWPTHFFSFLSSFFSSLHKSSQTRAFLHYRFPDFFFIPKNTTQAIALIQDALNAHYNLPRQR